MNPTAPLHLCQMCPSAFATSADLTAHMSKANHQRIKVICVFCTAQEKQFNRPHDLGQHVLRYHNQDCIKLPQKFFTTKNCFYMSNTPDDYRRQHTAAAWDDLAAKRARELVTEWIQRAGKAASRSLLQWRNGWDKACFSFDSEPELDYNDVSVVPSGKRSLPISMELVSLCLSTEETSATFICGDGDFLKVKLVPEVFHNIRAITSLTRLMGALKGCGTSTPPPDGHWELLQSPTFRLDAAEALQLDASLITAAFRCSIFKRRPVDPDTINFVLDASVEGIIEDTLSSSVPVDVSELDTLLLETLGQPADGVTATSLPAIEPDSIDTASPSAGISTAIANTPLARSPDATDVTPLTTDGQLGNVFQLAATYPAANIVETPSAGDLYTPTDVTPLTTDGQVSNVVQLAATYPAANIVETPSAGDLYTPTDVTHLTTDGQVSNVVQLAATYPAANINETPSAAAGDLYTPTVGTYALDCTTTKATAILELGAMPLVAPGRRNWESGVRVELFDGSLLWPPTNWKAMSNDERLQATEFAALSCLMPTRQEFRPRTRECLFDEFNFLVLPGTTVPQACGSTKLRYFNGEFLRRIANGEASDSTENSAIVTMLFRASQSRDRSLDAVIARVAKAGVSLKL